MISRLSLWTTLLFISILFTSGCLPIKSIFLGQPDKRDIIRFDASRIQPGEDCFQFKRGDQAIGNAIKINEWSQGNPRFMGLDEMNAQHPVRSFLIIRNDSILYEYHGAHTDIDALHASYSIAKSFTSALIGIAISEGHIKSERDLVTDYIPELKEVEGAEELRIEHLLNMTTGMKFNLLIDAQLYYGRNADKAFKAIKFEHAPGTKQHYLNVSIQLLGTVLHRSTGKTPAQYLEEKIWKPIGMCSEAIWTQDKKGENLAFCCLGATTADYAKFGRLFLNEGKWEGKQIIPTDWYKKSIRRDTTEGSSFGYNYCWHIGLEPYGDFLADGMYKQNIYMYPKKNIIIVLTANREKAITAQRIRWRNVFRQIVDQL